MTPGARRRAGVAAAALVLVSVAACGGDDGSSSSSTVASTISTLAPDPQADDATFDADAERVRAAIDAAGTDLCALSDTLGVMPNPTTPAEVETWVALYAHAFREAADAIHEEDAASAAALRTAMDDLEADARAADYSMDFISGEEPPAALASEAFERAATALRAAYTARCGEGTVADPDSVPDTTVPGAAP